MNIKLFFEAIIKFLLGVILVGLLIFIPAGTFEYFAHCPDFLQYLAELTAAGRKSRRFRDSWHPQ